MKTIQMLILATALVAVAACSKQENTEVTSQAPKAEMPAMEKRRQWESRWKQSPLQYFPMKLMLVT